MSTGTMTEAVKSAPPTVTKDSVLELAPGLIEHFSAQYLINPTMIAQVLMNTAFRPKKDEPPVSMSQLLMLLVVAKQYGLNPFTREIYAFPNNGGIVPIVGVDGWIRIIRERPELDGFEFINGPLLEKVESPVKPFEWIECKMYRKDNEHPTVLTEYYSECYRSTNSWKEMPKRMLRHKALIQTARYAFGFAGIYDEDEGNSIIQTTHQVLPVNNQVEDFPNGRVHHKGKKLAAETVVQPPRQEAPPAKETIVNGEVIEHPPAMSQEQEIIRHEIIESITAAINDPGSSSAALTDAHRLLQKHQALLGKDHAPLLQDWHRRQEAQAKKLPF